MQNTTGKLLKFQIEPEMAGIRLDAAAAALVPEYSRTSLQKLIKSGMLCIDGTPVTAPRSAVSAGMVLTLRIPEIAASAVPEAEDFAFPVLYEDEHMLVIDKPAGVVVHPAPGNNTGTVVNALLGRYPELSGSLDEFANRPGIVHRLDKDTSGCLVIAKTPPAQYKLSSAFAAREVHKTYLALLRGDMRQNTCRIENLIGRHPVNRQKMAVVSRNGKNAVSVFRKIASDVYGKILYSLAEVDILTGRTHQIRVHASHLGHPVLGDDTYGGVVHDFPASRQLLHAWRTVLPHPVTGEELAVTAPVPPDMASLIKNMKGAAGYVS